MKQLHLFKLGAFFVAGVLAALFAKFIQHQLVFQVGFVSFRDVVLAFANRTNQQYFFPRSFFRHSGRILA